MYRGDFCGSSNFFVGLAFAVVGIGAGVIYFFWNRRVRNTLQPIVDNSQTYELKVIKKNGLPKITIDLEYEKEAEIKLPEKEKADKELQFKNEDKYSVVSISSDDVGHLFQQINKIIMFWKKIIWVF